MDVNNQIILTDPARELAELCENLRTNLSADNVRGEVYLSERFGVEANSKAYFEILFTIAERVEEICQIINRLDLDQDYKDDLRAHVIQISGSFSAQSLRSPWSQIINTCLSRENVQPLKGLSGQVRQYVAYRKLNKSEIEEVNSDLDSLLSWLLEHQISENDFIRRALIEGLRRVRFRLKNLEWVGCGYALEGLKDVIHAYVMLERSGIDPVRNPDAEAMLKFTGGFITKTFAKLKTAKDVVDVGDLLLKAYGMVSLVQDGKPIIAAFLPSA